MMKSLLISSSLRPCKTIGFVMLIMAVSMVLSMSSAAMATDTDGDGIPDDVDNCPTTYNPDQADTEAPVPSQTAFETLDVSAARTDHQGQNGTNYIYILSTYTDKGGYGYLHYDGRYIEPNGNTYNPPRLGYQLFIIIQGVAPTPEQILALTTSSGVILVYLPATKVPTELYVADDGSTYYDEELTKLARMSDKGGDGVGDACDNCPRVYNPDQADRDASVIPFETLDLSAAESDHQGQNGYNYIYFRSTYTDSGVYGYLHHDGRYLEPNGNLYNPPTLGYKFYLTIQGTSPTPAQVLTLTSTSGEIRVYLPATSTRTDLYVADDGSTYYNADMTKLARVSDNPGGADGVGDACDNCLLTHNPGQVDDEPGVASHIPFETVDVIHAYHSGGGPNGNNYIYIKSTYTDQGMYGYLHYDGRYIEPNGDIHNPPTLGYPLFITVQGVSPTGEQVVALDTTSGWIDVFLPATTGQTDMYVARDGSTYYDETMEKLARASLNSHGDGVGAACDNCPDTYNPDQADSELQPASKTPFATVDVSYASTDHQGQNGTNYIYLRSTYTDQGGYGYLHYDGRYLEPNGNLYNPPTLGYQMLIIVQGTSPTPEQILALTTSSGTIDIYLPETTERTFLFPANDGSTYYDEEMMTLARSAERRGDGFGDACDNCPNKLNADQADLDLDGIGDLCDIIADLDSDRDVDLADFAIFASYWLEGAL